MRRLAKALAYLALVAFLGLVAASLLTPREPVTLPLPPLTGEVDRIVIEKSARRMQLFQDGKPVRTYRIALGFAPDGDKLRQGDGKTPEGEFTVDRRNDQSAFHLSLGLDYPRPADRARAAAGGYDPGGDIFIHGQPNALPDGLMLRGDWTAGCIAVTNREMREIWAAVPIGTRVEIVP
jgi:murein L,D-transpeptidase YafK